MKKLNLGIIGCGCISGIYLTNLTTKYENLNVYAVADLIKERVDHASEKYNVPHIMTAEEMFEDENIDVILNITTPPDHYWLSKKALEAGKHVYSEKTLALTYEQGKDLVDYAEAHGLYLGCAPDTFMGAAFQTAKKAIDDGMLGDIIGATGYMMSGGPEHWHPDPEFLYKFGAGPLFDMGPYYVTALAYLMGNVKSVMGMASNKIPQRVIGSQPKCGQIIDVEVPTYVNGILRFENGAIGNIIITFDARGGSNLPFMEIYGTKGTLYCTDPNCFGGDVIFKPRYDAERMILQPVNEYCENSRGLGLNDMAGAILRGDDNYLAKGKRALHTLEIMESILKSSNEEKELAIRSRK